MFYHCTATYLKCDILTKVVAAGLKLDKYILKTGYEMLINQFNL